MPEMIDPNAAEQREIQKRGVNVNFAGQLMLSMVQGCPGMADPKMGTKPEDLFAFAIGVAEQMGLYMNRPFDVPGRLIS